VPQRKLVSSKIAFWWRAVGNHYRRRAAEQLAIIRALPTAGSAAIVAAIGLQIAAGLLPVVFILATSRIIGRVAAGHSDAAASRGAWLALAVAAGAFLWQQVAAPIQILLTFRIGRYFDAAARRRIMRAAFSPRHIAALEEEAAAAELRTAGEAFQAWSFTPGDAASAYLLLISRYITATAMAVMIGIVFSWWAAALVLIASIGLRSVFRAGLARFAAAWELQNAPRQEAAYLRDLGLGRLAAKEIRILDLSDWLTSRYRAISLRWLAPTWHARWRIYFGPFVPATLLGIAATAATLGFAGDRATRSQLSLEDLAIVMQATLAVMRVAAFYPDSDPQTQFGMLGWGSMLRVERGFEQAVEPVTGAAEVTRPPRPEREIAFEGVHFSYPGNPCPVLTDLSLKISAGKATAIVGLNGAGKTTLVKLLARLYEPDRGRISVDGRDIHEFATTPWQRSISAIFQDYLSYELSVRDNVGFGCPEHLDDIAGITLALERAGAMDFVRSLPRGLETPLSRTYTDGRDLSGGQWQRIAIARALFAVAHGASILILDEPTASLDVRAETEFFEHVLAHTKDLTTVLISHRFSTVRRADWILLLEDGRIAERGTHDDLLAVDGRYAKLFRRQASRFADSAREQR